MKWLAAKVGDLLTLEYGKALPRSSRIETGNISVAGSNGIDGFHDVALVDGPGIVVGRKGSAGKVTWFDCAFWPIDTTYFVQHNDKVTDTRWLFYLLHSLKLERLSKTTGVPGLNRNDAYAEKCLLPPPNEQLRIVEILDEANRLRGLRVVADANAARILPALFLKMFGDPTTNPMEWEEKALSKVIARVEAGWSSRSEGRPCGDGEFGVLKVSAVTSGLFRPDENKAVLSIDASRELITPQRGDLLFSRANTRELVAASCVVDADFPHLFLPDKLWRLTPFPDAASTLFLRELFWQDGMRNKFRAASSGSSGSMLNISQESMLQTKAPIPPFELQVRFERLAWSIMATLSRASQATIRIEAIWDNLLQRAFSGQLTAAWREAHMKELRCEMEHQARALNLSVAL
jgi:type I restriction enzyme S subunit